MHTARSARPTHSPSLSAVEYTATASAPRSWQARTRRTAASPRFAIRTRRSMSGWLIPWAAWMLGAGWGALGVGSVRRAGWMMSWPRTIVASGVSQTSPVPRSSWNRPSRQPGEDGYDAAVTAIPFTRGVPSADMLPVADLEQAAVTALREDGARALAYSPGGYMPLREWIGERHRVDPARVLLVNGSLQGVAFLAQHLFLGRGGVAITEDPTYDRTRISLRTFGAEVVAVPVTPAGVDVDALEQTLAQRPARMLYLIPTFQNPSGVSLPEPGRPRVVELARRHEVLVVEDDPYGLLRFEGEPAPTLHELDGGDNVVYSCSFTKTVAPGIRTGYLVLPARMSDAMARLSENTLIAPNTFAEAALAAYCRAGRFEPNVERATAALRQRRDAMEAALREHFPAG